jgi:hypothetical protein
MTDTGSDERPAFCENCVKGFSWAGEATGSSRTLGAFKIVYVASAGETEGKPAVLLLTDVFGFDVGAHMVLLNAARPTHLHAAAES